jgi:hypothetical protein
MAWVVIEVPSLESLDVRRPDGLPVKESHGATLAEALASVPATGAELLDAARAILPRLSLERLHAVELWHIREAKQEAVRRAVEEGRLRIAAEEADDVDEDGDTVAEPTPTVAVDPACAAPGE